MINDSTNKALQDIEKSTGKLAVRARFFASGSIIVILIGLFLINVSNPEQSDEVFFYWFGYGMFTSIPLAGTALICQLLANILKMQIMSFRAANNLPLEGPIKEPRVEENKPEENYIGDIKLEDY